jgi:cell division protein FtsQ
MARESKKSSGFKWKVAGALVALGALCVSTGMAALRVRRYVVTDPQFMLSHERKDALSIQGVVHAPRGKVERVFAEDFERSVFSVPLGERRRRLLAIDWVEDAAVSRVWPDRLMVRIRERKPVAFVVLRGATLLVDAHGVLLDPPPQANFAFPVLRGVLEDEAEAQRREQVRLLLRVQEELGYQAKDISEVNVADPDNVRIMAQVEGQPVELIMGDERFGRRYQNFAGHYSEIRKRSPEAKLFDLRLDDRITVRD